MVLTARTGHWYRRVNGSEISAITTQICHQSICSDSDENTMWNGQSLQERCWESWRPVERDKPPYHYLTLHREVKVD